MSPVGSPWYIGNRVPFKTATAPQVSHIGEPGKQVHFKLIAVY